MFAHCFLLLLSALSFSAHAQSSGDVLPAAATGAIQLIDGGGSGVVVEQSGSDDAGFLPSEERRTWVDVGRVIDAFRIPEKLADLRGVTVDASGANYGFYFASASKRTFAVYRNGRIMARGDTENTHDLQVPVVFRMTGSGDLLYALHGTDLYVNAAPVSLDAFSFSASVDSVHDEGGILTFPEGGDIVRYDVKAHERSVLYSHEGSVEFLRRSGDTIAYTVRHRGIVRMVRNGRRVSARAVDNPRNFAVDGSGNVYYFTKSARGYSLYRNGRAYATGKGAGAYVAVDPHGVVWHLSYIRGRNDTTVVGLRKGRSPANLLPERTDNAELFLHFQARGEFAMRASFAGSSDFYLVEGDGPHGKPFRFDYPHNDMGGFVEWGGWIVMRAHDGAVWRAYAHGEPLSHASFRNVWAVRSDGEELTIYATR